MIVKWRPMVGGGIKSWCECGHEQIWSESWAVNPRLLEGGGTALCYNCREPEWRRTAVVDIAIVMGNKVTLAEIAECMIGPPYDNQSLEKS